MATEGTAPTRSSGKADIPVDAKVIINILQSMGVEEYEPRVIHQFLEFTFRYITDVLGDARVYSEHASKPTLDIDDVKLAIQSRVNFSFTQPPPREVLLELAKARNSIPLPPFKDNAGIPLPPEEDTLIMPNYQVKVPSRLKTVMREPASTPAGNGATKSQAAQAALAGKKVGAPGRFNQFTIGPPSKRAKGAH